jgi:hypothetical protein
MEIHLTPGNAIVGSLLLLFGLLHIFVPNAIRKAIRAAYGRSPFIRDQKQLEVRQGYLIAFGITWTFVGLIVFLFG